MTALPRRGRAWSYPLAGALLALGAPAGLLVVRAVTARAWPGATWLRAEILGDLPAYTYLLSSTTVVFVGLGRLLGRREDELAAGAITDALTGLANRRHFDARLDVELDRTRRHGTPVSLLAIDVDGLKTINDRGGHAAGDAALKTVAAALAGTCRRSDLAARTGGDEFVVLAVGSEAPSAIELAERFRAALARLPNAPTVSVGIADTRSCEPTPRELRKLADETLYRAKRGGRNCVLAAGPHVTSHAGDGTPEK